MHYLQLKFIDASEDYKFKTVNSLSFGHLFKSISIQIEKCI